MKKSSKGRAERRKNPRSRGAKGKPSSVVARPDLDSCHHCAAEIGNQERALFVEEELGRIFCSEKCIADYFSPDIGRLEKEYFRLTKAGDLTPRERETYSHLRWITLQEPDEVWRQKTIEGDNRFTLISQFEPGSKKVWSICICLFLKGEPSFLYLAFATRNAAMVEHYRRGERVEWTKAAETTDETQGSNHLAGPWTEDEMLRAQMGNERNSNDIPQEEFKAYERFVQETVEDPDELWSVKLTENSASLYHFVKLFGKEDPSFWYIVVAKETGKEEEIEIVDVFPTRDVNLVNQYRRGELEMSKEEDKNSSGRVVH